LPDLTLITIRPLHGRKDKELREVLKSAATDKPDEMFNEYEFQLFEQQEFKREVQLRKERDFRGQVMTAIWSCGEGGFPEIANSRTAATDTVSKIAKPLQ
jgi:hypothetical protein